MEQVLSSFSMVRPRFPGLESRIFGPTRQIWLSLDRPQQQHQLRCRAQSQSKSRPSPRRKLPKNLERPRRAKLPPVPAAPQRVPVMDRTSGKLFDKMPEKGNKKLAGELPKNEYGDSSHLDSWWSVDELEAISALFERPMPQKSVKPTKERPLPLPVPYKTRSPGFPTPKRHVRLASCSALSTRSSFSDRICKNPEALVAIAREIGELPPERDASEVLDRRARFLQKGSLSMTIRELGHMGLPERALQTFCWVQKQHSLGLFPDDRTLASTVEILARFGQLKIEPELEKYLNSGSRTVIEAMARGFIRAGNLIRARKILLYAKDNKRTLDCSVYAKFISEAGKTPDGYKLASAVLEELGEREEFDLKPQDCTSIMKVCIKLQRFDAVENLFNWHKQSGKDPTVVMYTTLIYSRYCERKYKDGMALVWEMERSNCLLDLPAYRVIIRLFVAMNDLARATQYFSKLKDAGFNPTYDIYRDIINVYAASGRLAKCRQVCKEMLMAGFKLDRATASLLSELEREAKREI